MGQGPMSCLGQDMEEWPSYPMSLNVRRKAPGPEVDFRSPGADLNGLQEAMQSLQSEMARLQAENGQLHKANCALSEENSQLHHQLDEHRRSASSRPRSASEGSIRFDYHSNSRESVHGAASDKLDEGFPVPERPRFERRRSRAWSRQNSALEGITKPSVIYEEFKDTKGDFLRYICLEQKGGLHRIKDIWQPRKYLWFAILIGSCFLNMAYLLTADWTIFVSFVEDVLQQREEALDISRMSPNALQTAARNQQTSEIVIHLQDHPRTRSLLLTIAALVATWEVVWVFVNLVHFGAIWWIFTHDPSEYRAFHAVMLFFQKLLPHFSTFSAMKLMAKIHPSLVGYEYLEWLERRHTWRGKAIVTVTFSISHVLFASAAICAFIVKIVSVSLRLINPQYDLHVRLGSALALMNQCLGCVILEVLLQDRLLLFVFGGQDAAYGAREQAYKNVYESLVAKQIWCEFWEKGERLKAIVLLATFDHYDLQRLLISDVAHSGGADWTPGETPKGPKEQPEAEGSPPISDQDIFIEMLQLQDHADGWPTLEGDERPRKPAEAGRQVSRSPRGRVGRKSASSEPRRDMYI